MKPGEVASAWRRRGSPGRGLPVLLAGLRRPRDRVAGAELRLVGPDCPVAAARVRAGGVGAAADDRWPPATLEEAAARAAELLAGQPLPLFGGLGTDVAGMREVLALAERTGGIVDHAGSRGLLANVRAMQDGGWVTATLAEVRNRADLVLFVGTDTVAIAPRLVERCLAPSETLFGPLERRLVYLGPGARPCPAPRRCACPPEALGEVLAVLRALAAGGRITAERGRACGGVVARARPRCARRATR